MHTYVRMAVVVAGLTSAAAGAAAPAAAQMVDTNERTKITIDKPVEIPGSTLQPGAYWFELIDSKVTRQAVRVQNEDESKTIATLIAVPVYRQLDATKGDTQLTLSPTSGSSAAALESWFFPGKQYGHQFVYPKAQASQIAGRSKRTILVDDDGKIMRLNAEGTSEPWTSDEKGRKDSDRKDTEKKDRDKK